MRYNEIIENMDHSKDGGAVEELRAALMAHKDKLQDATDDQVYDTIDKMMTRIAKTHSVSGQKLHDMWVHKYKQVPDTWIMKEGWRSAVAAGALAAATAMGSPVHAAEPSDFVAKISMQVNGQTIKKEIKLGSDYRSADDARTAVEKFLAKKGVNNYTVHIERVLDEAFDNPYKGKWEKSEYSDSVDMLVKLPDGTNLSIMFNQEYGDEGEEVTQVEFHRNNSQDVTGEGDAQRIFATVLDAIQKYIKKYIPQRLSFSASKQVDMDADDVEHFNPESRAKLYDRLVQRYARAWGYRAFRADNGDIVIYELSRLKPAVAEGKQPGKPVVDAILKVMPVTQEIWFHGSRATGQHRKNSDTDILVVIPDDLVGDQYLSVVRILQKLSSHFDNYDIQPTKAGTNIHRIAQEEGRLLWSSKQGVAEDQVHEADASAVQFQTASTDNYQSSFTVTAIADGKNVGHFSFFRDPETDDVHNQAEVTDDVRGKGYGKALLLKAIEVANDHGLGFQEDSQSLSRAQSRVYDSLYDAGWIVDADGYWFLTPEGEQELARLSTIQQGVAENFADGKNPGRKGLAKRSGVNTKASVSSLRNTAKHSSGEKQRMAHWLANMKAGRAKKK